VPRPTAATDGAPPLALDEAPSPAFSARSQGSAAAQEFVPGDDVEALLRAAREALDMPVAFLSRFCGTELVVQAVDSDHPVALHAGDRQTAARSYCQLVVDGQIPQAVPDTSANVETASLAATSALGIGSYVGVPVLLPDGSTFGSLCAYGEQARDVDARDSAVLALVARTMGQQLGPALQHWQQEQGVRRRVREVIDGDLITAVYNRWSTRARGGRSPWRPWPGSRPATSGVRTSGSPTPSPWGSPALWSWPPPRGRSAAWQTCRRTWT